MIDIFDFVTKVKSDYYTMFCDIRISDKWIKVTYSFILGNRSISRTISKTQLDSIIDSDIIFASLQEEVNKVIAEIDEVRLNSFKMGVEE